MLKSKKKSKIGTSLKSIIGKDVEVEIVYNKVSKLKGKCVGIDADMLFLDCKKLKRRRKIILSIPLVNIVDVYLSRLETSDHKTIQSFSNFIGMDIIALVRDSSTQVIFGEVIAVSNSVLMIKAKRKRKTENKSGSKRPIHIVNTNSMNRMMIYETGESKEHSQKYPSSLILRMKESEGENSQGLEDWGDEK
jgi:hypothetical protein